MRRQFFSAIKPAAVCVVAVSLAFAQAAQQAPLEASSIRGTVVNSLTHEAIGRALVYSPDNRFATLTDGEGHFEFTLPAVPSNEENTEVAGSTAKISRTLHRPSVLTARKPGFLQEQRWISITGTAREELTIPLTPEALIVGRVALPSQDASDRIQLELYRREVQEGRAHWASRGMATTRSNGEFRFAELGAGSYKLLTREMADRDPLTFDPRGQQYAYPPVYFPNARDFSSAQTIQLTAGQTFQANITLVRHPYYQVRVPVVNATPGGMNVSVYAHSRGPGYALGYDGQAIVGTLPDGTYTLEASSFGANSATGLLNITVKGGPVEGPHMTMVPNGTINVNVKEEFTSGESENFVASMTVEGHPFTLQGARRYLSNMFLEPADDFSPEQRVYLRNPTGPEDDSLVIDNVRPGRYWVRTGSARGFASSVSSGGLDLLRQPLVVSAGGTNSPIEVILRDDGADVQGTVEGVAKPAGQAVADSMPVRSDSSAHVYLIPRADSSGQFQDRWVGPDGKFGMQQVPPGAYLVLAFDQPQSNLEYRNPEAMREYESKGQTVRLAAGQKQQLQLQVISTSE